MSNEGEEKLFGKDFAKNFQEGSLKEFLKRPPPHLTPVVKTDKNYSEYLIIVQHLFKVHIGKLDFIWLARKDNLMLSN